METKYSTAWNKYLKSDEYKRAEKALSAKGLKQPYLNNILKGAFEAGRNLKEVVLPLTDGALCRRGINELSARTAAQYIIKR